MGVTFNDKRMPDPSFQPYPRVILSVLVVVDSLITCCSHCISLILTLFCYEILGVISSLAIIILMKKK